MRKILNKKQLAFIASKIDEYIKDHGSSNQDLANLVEASVTTMSRWRTGKNSPRGIYLTKILEILKIRQEDIDDLAASINQ